MGVDLSERAGAPDIIPNKAKDLGGAVYGKIIDPAFGLISAASQAIVEAAKQNPTHFMEDAGAALKGAYPNTIGLRLLLQTLGGESDRFTGARERTILKNATPGERFVKGIGIEPTREAEEQREYRVRSNISEYQATQRKKHIDAYIAGETATINDWPHLKQEFGITQRMVDEERKNKRRTPTERQARHLPKNIRRGYDIYNPEQ
jgi:hypothetical protein